jgi:hypothetical protein
MESVLHEKFSTWRIWLKELNRKNKERVNGNIVL